MKRKSNIKFCFFICFICVLAVFFTGCGKRWWDNWDGSYVWVSDKPYIYMPLDHEGVIIEIDGEKWNVDTAWDPDGTKIYFNEKWARHTKDGEIWVAEVKLKKDKLYLKIIEDYYGDYKGQEFVLEKRPVKEEQKTKDIMTNTTENSTQDIPEKQEDNTEKSMPDVPEDHDDSLTFDITDYYTEGQEQDTSPDAYRTIYAQIIKKLPEDIDFGFICLDDDDIPELVIQPERIVYFIYTVRDGALSCLVDFFHTKEMDYYERSGIISAFWTSRGGGDSGGYGYLYYQVSEDQTIKNGIDPILTWSYEAIYDENDNFTGEGEVTCSYMDRDIDEEAYDEVCRKLEIDGERRSLGGGIDREAAVLMLSHSDPADPASSGKAHDAYREAYKKKLEDSSGDTEIYFIYLDDDDIPELVSCENESLYSVYTFKDGELFCLADSMKTEFMYYYERQSVICLSDGWEWESEGRKLRYYQTSAKETLTDDSQLVLESSSKELYGEEGRKFEEENVLSHYRYMGQDTDRETYEKICGELEITEDRKKGNILEKEIALEILNP